MGADAAAGQRLGMQHRGYRIRLDREHLEHVRLLHRRDVLVRSVLGGGVVAFTGDVVCGDGVLETLTAGYDEPFDNGEVLCNTWLNIGGKPCETIHS